jgi:hypothetical protein
MEVGKPEPKSTFNRDEIINLARMLLSELADIRDRDGEDREGEFYSLAGNIERSIINALCQAVGRSSFSKSGD